MDTIKVEKMHTHNIIANETLDDIMSLKSEKVPLASFNAS